MHAITSFHDQVITHLSKYACNGTYYQTLYDRIIGVPQLNALIFFTTLSQKLYCGISSRDFHYLTRCIQATLFHLLFWYSKEKASSSPKVCSNGNKRRQKIIRSDANHSLYTGSACMHYHSGFVVFLDAYGFSL